MKIRYFSFPEESKHKIWSTCIRLIIDDNIHNIRRARRLQHFLKAMDIDHSNSSIRSSVRAMLSGAIDYAGLFPPAGLSMSEAVINYAKYRNSNYRWMLGSFVLSAAQLPDFVESARDFISRDSQRDWSLSVIAGEDINDTFRRIEAFSLNSLPGVRIESIEVKANSSSKIENTVRNLPRDITAYFELGSGENLSDLMAQLALNGQRAKIRTGGITTDAFPSSNQVLRFVRTCLAANVPFKATAGLHHPIRCFKPLTYENNAPKGTMHGFLNLFMATAFTIEGYRDALLEDVMEEEFAEVFRFGDQSATWRDDHLLTLHQIETLRKIGIQSFGSCSFEEPIADLQALGIL